MTDGGARALVRVHDARLSDIADPGALGYTPCGATTSTLAAEGRVTVVAIQPPLFDREGSCGDPSEPRCDQ